MSRKIPKNLRDWVQRQDDERCAYCHSHERMSITPFDVDHIVPVHSGGLTEQGNLCLCCPACNRFKGANQRAIDPVTGDLVPLFHPRQQVWSDHFAFDASGIIIVGRTPIGRSTVSALQMNRSALVELRRLWQRLGS